MKAIEKLKIKKKKKSRAQLDHDYIFCIINERDLFFAANNAIDRGTEKPEVNRHFTLIGLQILNILIEQTQRS